MGRATRKTISEVRQRLAELDSARETLDTERERTSQLLELLEQFGNGSAPQKRGRKRATKKQQSSHNTAKDQIHTWLKQNQGSSRGDIIKGTGLPTGTVGAYLSTEKNMFERREDGWYAL